MPSTTNEEGDSSESGGFDGARKNHDTHSSSRRDQMGITPLARRGVPWRQPRFGTRVLVMETRMSLIIVPFAVNIVSISLRLIETRTRILIGGKLYPGLVNF